MGLREHGSMDLYNHSMAVNMCRILIVLNAVKVSVIVQVCRQW